ncbi:MAG TPA: hypothetical protein RMH99_13315 [Sandaracinaceae bacterium LLY-WYZ-13_1]|nr:hypothetical protein [Sandaracinaceae bacterium LLY-WYZ-13_1]
MRASIVFVFALLALALAGCEEEPVGLDPADYCSQLEQLTGQVADTCRDTQGRLREEEPAYYECMSNCVETSTAVEGFGDCTRACGAMR